MNCPQCGSLPAKYLGTFQCGSLTDSGGFLHHTNFCKEFSEFRKPLDEKIADLDSQLESAEDTIEGLREELRDANDRAETYRSALRPGQLRKMEEQ